MPVLSWFAAAALLQAAPEVPPQADPALAGIADSFVFEKDRTARMTVPVSINGGGPYNFIVDTGAERTVISEELARKLKLGEGNSARLHSMSEVQEVSTVVIPTLRVSKNVVEGIHAPAMLESNLGADGMLGVDSLKSQRVLFDFEKQTMSVSPSRSRIETNMDGDTIIVRARSKFGRLILADARADGEKVWVVIDTGSQVSIGNEALRKRLEARKKLRWVQPVQLLSVTGGKLQADYTQIKELKVGGVDLQNMPIAFVEAHPFKKLGLTDRPALLLGMDSLALFDRVAIDFASRTIRFDMPTTSDRQTNTRFASLNPAGRPVGQ